MVWGDSDEYVWNSPADTFLLIHQLLPVVEELSKMQPHGEYSSSLCAKCSLMKG